MGATVDHAAIERLGDEIAELSAHLDAASARVLELILALLCRRHHRAVHEEGFTVERLRRSRCGEVSGSTSATRSTCSIRRCEAVRRSHSDASRSRGA
jgi:hypothetical protein